MSLVVHLVRKDWERVRAPLFAWYALIAGKAWCVWRLMRSAEVATNLAPLGAFVGMLNGIEAVAGALLAFRLAFDDKPWSATAFSATRPISRRELLGAKAAGGMAFLIVGPLVLLAPVWLASGFSASGIGVAATDWALVQGLFVALGLLAGALARDPGQVMLAVPLLGGVLLGCALWMPREPGAPMWLSVALAAVVAGAGIVIAYRVRRRLVGLIVAALGLVGVARLGVPALPEQFLLPAWPDSGRPVRKGETRVAGSHRWILVGHDYDEKGRLVLVAQSARPSYPLLDTLREPLPPGFVRLAGSDDLPGWRWLVPLRQGTVRTASLSVTRWQLALREPVGNREVEWPLFANAVLRCEANPENSTP